MTDIEKKALEQAVAAAGRRMRDYAIMAEGNLLRQSIEAHARAIEQHEAFKCEVSDAVERVFDECEEHIPIAFKPKLRSFIIAKPDPLVEVWDHMIVTGNFGPLAFRAAIEARGGRIVWEGE